MLLGGVLTRISHRRESDDLGLGLISLTILNLMEAAVRGCRASRIKGTSSGFTLGPFRADYRHANEA